ncbi:MAG: hypothetical protein A2992_06110 [Elusimicrobia bacterium RIFCSPLOWO2_01_FULL_59_12]|nr:MAG: hypothetical protein A2992_06110 [Elusimicrobia bacterium RIFCSPLOWO2_01_FULL_59_12]
MHKKYLSLLLPLALLAAGCSGSRSRLQKAAGPSDEIVEAEGMAPYNAADVPGSRAAALAAAQRNAVELVVGVYVTGKTRVEKAVAIENRILAHVQGYVKRYQVLSEGKNGNVYKVRIRALVSTEKLHDDLDSLGLLREPALGNPRVAIVVHEWIGEKQISNGEATRTLMQGLIDKGFQVVTLPSSIQRENDPVEIARTLNRGQAELVVAGLARAQSLGYEKKLGGMSSYRAAINIRVIEVGSGQVLSTVSQVASGMEGTPEIAGGKALGKAAELAVVDLASLPEQLSKRSLVTMKITGLTSFEKLSEVLTALSALSGVKDVFMRSFNQSGGEAHLEFHIDGISSQEVAGQIVKTGGTGWSIYQVEGRTIQLSASPAGR